MSSQNDGDNDDDDEDDGDAGDDDAGDDDARTGGRVPRSCLVGGNQTIIVCAPTICQNIKLQLFSSFFCTTSRFVPSFFANSRQMYLLFYISIPFLVVRHFGAVIK